MASYRLVRLLRFRGELPNKWKRVGGEVVEQDAYRKGAPMVDVFPPSSSALSQLSPQKEPPVL